MGSGVAVPNKPLTNLGAEIWEGDERRRFRFIESGDSLNGRNLFTELPSPVIQ